MVPLRQWTKLGLFLAAIAVGPSSRADEPSPGELQFKAESLVNQLSHDLFSRRERATDELVRLGIGAIPSLQKGAESADREVRYRCTRIISIIRDKDFQRRLEAFAASPSGDHDLPGWQRYRKLIGEDAESRSLFVEMQRSEAELLAAFELGPRNAADNLARRVQEIQEAMQWFQRQVSLGSIAALLFAAGDEDVPVPEVTNQWMYNFCYQQSMQQALQGGNRKDLMRKMLGRFIRRSSGWAVSQGLNLAVQHNIPDGIVLAERVVKGDVAMAAQPHIRQMGILTLAKMGTAEHVPLLEKLLDDRAVLHQIRNNNVQSQTLICDVALAAMIYLSKQNFKDFGLNNVQTNVQPFVLNTSTISFPNDDQRSAAIKKWRESREKQPQK